MSAVHCIVRLAHNIFDLVGRIPTDMDTTREEKSKRSTSKSSKGSSQESGKKPSSKEKEKEKDIAKDSHVADGVRDVEHVVTNAETRVEGDAPSLSSLAKTLAELSENLKSVQSNQDDLVTVMMEAGAGPLSHGKGKGGGANVIQRPLPRSHRPRV